ncbi:MAG: heme biosynthesis protein HemY, partial [Proteobacteria bacterium]|nr:heme biosynthesis protein HemY [Pseudomonadota bacterium]
MRRVIAFLIVGVAVIAAAWGLAILPGHVSATVGTFRIETSASLAILSLAIAFLVGVLLLRLLIWLVTLPFASAGWRQRSRVRTGERAITRVLIALASGEDRVARREARRARDVLGDTPQTLLLAAEAGRLAGREDEAEEAYRTLTKREDGRFLGYRGLLRQAIERRDWVKADELAREAEAARPGTAWLREQRAELAVQNNGWAEAAELSGASGQRAVYFVAAADSETDPVKALAYAKQAWRIDPYFTPAVLAYARLLRVAGKEKRALAAINEAWKKAPHPDLAEFALATASSPQDRLAAAKRLAAAAPGHLESRIIVARTATDAGQFAEARQAIEAAKADGFNQRRLWLLTAELAEAERGDTEEGRAAQRDAFRQAAEADPDPVWRCTSCRTEASAWAPRCPSCGTVGTLSWQAP